MARKLTVEIIGDSSSLEKAFKQSTKSAEGFGSGLGKLAKGAAIAAGAAGVGALYVTLKAGIGDFAESQKVAAQTGAVLKSTGQAANVTAKDVDNLAQSISNYSGIDDEAVAAGENMLLTFTNIQNRVGKNNDIFNQATKVTADYATALGTDMTSAAMQLGKALNDPAKGMTKLQRVGVTFTDAQKKTVESLMKTGDVAGAQKVILGELSKEFGGSAKAAGETLPGQLNILKNSFSNMAGSLVGSAVPALTSFMGLVTSKGLPAIQALFGAISEKVGPALSTMASAFQQAAPGILAVLKPLGESIKNTLVPVFQALMEIGSRAIQAIGQVLAQNGPQFKQIFENLGVIIGNLAKVILPILEIAFTKILPVAIRVLIPVLVTLTGAIAKITTVAREVANFLTGVFSAAFTAVQRVVEKVGPIFSSAWSAVSRAVDAAWRIVKPLIDGFRQTLQGLLNFITGVFTGNWGQAWEGLKQAAMGGWNTLKAWATGLPAVVLGWGKDIGAAIIRGIASGMDDLLQWLLSKASGIVDAVKDKLEFWKSPPEAYGRDIGQRLVGQKGLAGGIEEETPKAASAAAKAVQEAIQKANQAITDARGSLGSAWGELASAAMSAFDSKMQDWKPASQLRLDKMQLQQQMQQLNQAITEAGGVLTRGPLQQQIKSLNQAMLQAQSAGQTELAAAYRAKLEVLLGQQAQVEQAAHDKKVARQRLNLQSELNQLQAYLQKHPDEYGKVQAKINKLLEKNGVDAKFWGTAVGISLAAGLKASEKAVAAAADAVAKAIAKRLKLKSPAEEGPLSDLDTWWEGLAPSLLKGINLGLIKQAGTTVAQTFGAALIQGTNSVWAQLASAWPADLGEQILASISGVQTSDTEGVGALSEQLTELPKVADASLSQLVQVTQELMAQFVAAVKLATDAFTDLTGIITTLPPLGERGFEKLAKAVSDYLVPLPEWLAPIDLALRAIEQAILGIGRASYVARASLRDTVADIGSLLAQLSGASGVSIPGRQHGGPVKAGSPYVVGEVGPELFIPSTSGRIIPAGEETGRALSGGRGSITFNFPNYVGSHDELIRTVREGLLRVDLYNPGSAIARS